MLTRGEALVDQGQQRYEQQQHERSVAASRRRAAAVGNERIVGIDGDAVRVRMRDNQHGGKRKVVRINGTTFVERFMSHVLPGGFDPIRHDGLQAPAAKALAMPQPNPQAVEDDRAFMRRLAAIEIDRCPYCRVGRQVLIEVIEPLLEPTAPQPSCRGPAG